MTAPAADGTADAARPPGPRPARAFLWLAGGVGLFFLLFTPPLQTPDEIRHLVRASAIARGQLLAEARPDEYASVEVPRDLVLLEKRLGARALYRHPERKPNRAALGREARRSVDESDRIRVAVPSLYSPLPYLHQALAMAALRPFGASPLTHVFVGRFANLVLYLLLVALALRWLPAHRWTLFLVAATPIAVFEAAALGADAPTNALALLLTAFALRAAQAGRGRIGGRELGGLAALAALLALAKPGYAPLSLLVLLVPGARFATPRARATAVAGVLAAGVLPTVLWLAMLHGLPLRPLASDADPAGQLAYLLSHPFEGVGVLARTLVSRCVLYLRSGVGDLGHLDVSFPAPAWAIYPLALAAVAVFDGGRASPLRGRQRAWLVVIAGLAWTATVLLAYIGWNPVGADVIRYVQGRYFLPFVALPYLALHRAAGAGLPAWGAQAALAFAVCELLLGAVLLFQRYWG